jgi:hypothetical protein
MIIYRLVTFKKKRKKKKRKEGKMERPKWYCFPLNKHSKQLQYAAAVDAPETIRQATNLV